MYLIGTISVTLAMLAYSEWRIRRLTTHSLPNALQALQAAMFDEDVSKDGKTRRLRPSARLQAFLLEAVPGLIDWARENVHIKLPPFELPEGVDLKTVGMSSLATKVMSGKKLKLDDAIPLALGYAMDYLDKTGILDKLKPAIVEKKKEAVNPFLKELQP